MPDLRGMGLKDALGMAEGMDLRKVGVKGTGKVRNQSIDPGSPISKNQTLILDLN
jgi:cell division protein FtsI (penicillin-binding protein 3)